MKKQKLHPVFDGIDPNELENPVVESAWRKPLFFLVGVFLLVLIVSLSFSDFLQSFVHSSSVERNVLYFPNATVVFENDSLALLQSEFVENQHREIKACLFGRVSDSHYYIERVIFPDIIRANVIHVVSVPCPDGFLIDLHSHPIGSCLASDQDISSFSELKKRDSRVRMMVMCSSERFALI